MRKQGKIARWDDGRGFGFIAGRGKEGDIFVHITAFPGTVRRPEVGEVVSYEIGQDQNGKTRAENVRFADQGESQRLSARGRNRETWQVLYALVFVCFLIASALFERIPWWLVGVYGVLSLITFFVYGYDKLSAKLGQWRTAESTLHLLGLLGGWPGGLAAQRVWRHKSSKRAFLVAFWMTVLLNVMAVSYLVWRGEAGIMIPGLDRVWSNGN